MAVTTSWQRKCSLTIDHTKVLEDLTDFPVCLTKDNVPIEMITSGGSYACKTDGSDIRITTDSDGTTECPLEVVVCNQATSALEIHTKLPLISSSIDTKFYIWYKNSVATAYDTTATYGRNNVWNSNYVYVTHCQSTTCVDSTGKHSDGSPQDSVTTGAGVVQNGLNHATPSKYTQVADDTDTRIDNLWTSSHGFALEVFPKTNSTFDPDSIDNFLLRHILISKGMNWNANYKQEYAFGFWETNTLGFEYYGVGTWNVLSPNSSPTGSWAANTQYYTALRMTRTGSGYRKYTYVIGSAGSFRAETEQTASYDYDTITGSRNYLSIAGHSNVDSETFYNWTDNGVTLDEVRISMFERSVGWLKTTSNAVSSPSTFIIEGIPENTSTVTDLFIDDGIMGGVMRGLRFLF